MGSRVVPYDKDVECDNCGKRGAHDFMGDYLCDDCVGYTEPDDVIIPKVGLDAFNELAESHESHVCQVKKLEEELQYYKQLDCEGVDVNSPKGKIDITHQQVALNFLDNVYKKDRKMLIKLVVTYIRDNQSEMDLQTKGPDSIVDEFIKSNEEIYFDGE